MTKSYDILIVGAGPAGLMSAIGASRQGARVCLLEQQPGPGRKLLATGGGRCNLTNTCAPETMLKRFGQNWRFVRPALHTFSRQDLVEFFEARGLKTCVEDDQYVFPVCQSAKVVLDCLLREAEGSGSVALRTDSAVTRICTDDGAVSGVETAAGVFSAPAVILATGGKSYPALGANGTGWDLAQALGHAILKPFPGLVPVATPAGWVHACTGITVEGEVWIDTPSGRKEKRQGPLLFTHRGLSGPVILDLSADISMALVEQVPVPLCINLVPQETDWPARFAAWQKEQGKRTVAKTLQGVLPARLVQAIAGQAGDCGSVRLSELKRDQRKGLIQHLSAAPIPITATEGWNRAMVTRGGVSTKEIRPGTLESRRIKGLYLAGEMVDVDGPCGGYNLQWAFSSGWLAGQSACSPTAQ